MDTVRAFLSKIRTLFWFSKRTGEASHLPLVAHQCPWICLIYPWKCLNTLFWLCQCSEYAWSSILHFRQTFEDASSSKYATVLNMTWMYMQELGRIRICLIMAPYASIMPIYASICPNVYQYAWAWLNIPEYPWKCLKMPQWITLTIVSQGSQNAEIYSAYHNIIFVANVIVRILVWSIYTSWRSATILSFFNTS